MKKGKDRKMSGGINRNEARRKSRDNNKIGENKTCGRFKIRINATSWLLGGDKEIAQHSS